jgi:hypothetical protein
MSEARERGGRDARAIGEVALELRAHPGRMSEARERGGRDARAIGEIALELRAHQEEK